MTRNAVLCLDAETSLAMSFRTCFWVEKQKSEPQGRGGVNMLCFPDVRVAAAKLPIMRWETVAVAGASHETKVVVVVVAAEGGVR